MKSKQVINSIVIRISVGMTAAVVLFGAVVAFKSAGAFFVTADQRGQRLFRAGQFAAAAEAFTNPRWQGAAQFRAADFKQAASSFAGLPGHEAAYNQGNALMMQGKYDDAVKRYDRALELRPNWDKALTNRAIAAGRAERVKREGGDSTGGELGADDVVFSNNKSKNGGEEQIVESEKLSDEEMRGMWLRQVQTTPSQFLRSKFAYQNAASANQPNTGDAASPPRQESETP